MAVWIRVHPAWKLLTIHSQINISFMDTLGRQYPVILVLNITHKDFRPSPSSDLRSSNAAYPNWILKRGVLESSVQRLISFNVKTKRILFTFQANNFVFEKIMIFSTESAHWAGSVQSSRCQFVVCCPIFMPFFLGLSLALRLWQDQPGSSPLEGSTRQQPVGRINQSADRWQDQPGSRSWRWR